jgi:outer membrane lipoprotein-sorting protein
VPSRKETVAKDAKSEKTTKDAKKPSESEADKFVRASADKLENLDHISAKMRQVIHFPDQDITATGIYKRGPNHRGRIELDVQTGEAAGKRIQVCDGKTAYIYEKLLDAEDVKKIDIRQVITMLERKEIVPDVRTFFMARLPLVRPADMLRGYLNVVTFTKMTPQEVGKRKVVVVEGQWKDEVLASLAGKANATPNDLPGLTPQRIRVVFDAESRWPLRIELFRRDEHALFKPIYSLEFPDLELGKKLPDQDFTWQVPTHLIPQDLTPLLLQELKAASTAASTRGSAATKTAADSPPNAEKATP